MDLRQCDRWCHDHQLSLFAVHRAGIDSFARHLELVGRTRALPVARPQVPPRLGSTIARRLCTARCSYGYASYRYAVEEGALEHFPAVHVRRPRLDDDSNAVNLDRNEVGALLVAGGLPGARDHALISLLALNGPRVSEAFGADTERLGLARGHRTSTVLRKGVDRGEAVLPASRGRPLPRFGIRTGPPDAPPGPSGTDGLACPPGGTMPPRIKGRAVDARG